MKDLINPLEGYPIPVGEIGVYMEEVRELEHNYREAIKKIEILTGVTVYQEKLLEEKEEEVKKLRDALQEAIFVIKGVEIFIKSRERINKPTGEYWFDDKLTKLIETLKEGNI